MPGFVVGTVICQMLAENSVVRGFVAKNSTGSGVVEQETVLRQVS